MMKFITYYRLRYNPFSKESVTTQNAYRSRDFKEMDFRLNTLSETRGIGLFTAPPGAGKTLALRCFMDGLNPNLFKPHYIPLSTVSVAEFYKQWCDLLGVDTRGGKPRMLRNMKEQMLNMYKAKRQPLFLVLDEAQYLSTAILNDLKKQEARQQGRDIYLDLIGLADDFRWPVEQDYNVSRVNAQKHPP